MIFTALDFWVFFVVVFAGFALLASKVKLRNAYLFLVSCYFYYQTSGTFLLLLLFSILFAFLMGLGIKKSKTKPTRNLLIGVSVSVHLAFLCYFKYAYFFADVYGDLIGSNVSVFNPIALFGNLVFQSDYFRIDRILLPVGISFFTFQIITYLVDIYREKLEPVKSIFDFGFYVSFFPQLVAGPIVRASEFLPQLYKSSILSKVEFGMALFMILKGLFKKIFIGDYLAVNFIDRVFSNPLSYTGFENVTALIAYSMQVYVDFSGYTDIAIGLSLMMGFKLNDNFNSPYKALNVGDFWRRWHISLSTFLKDYLYIPIGGNKHGAFRTNVNLMITMLLGGLWHGASWNFIIWGAINGAGLLVYKSWKKISPYENSNHWAVRIWRIGLTFAFITFTRLWFRAPDLRTVKKFYTQVSSNFGWEIIPDFLMGFRYVLLVLVLSFVLHWLNNNFKSRWRDRFINAHPIIQGIICIVTIIVIYQSVSAEAQPFIYFQF
jgi:alginate O-acetyltransferase complex protein AlgI